MAWDQKGKRITTSQQIITNLAAAFQYDDMVPTTKLLGSTSSRYTRIQIEK
jgi:hypothetical protein